MNILASRKVPMSVSALLADGRLIALNKTKEVCPPNGNSSMVKLSILSVNEFKLGTLCTVRDK